MPARRVERLRALLLLVIVWLLAVTLIGVLRGSLVRLGGLVVVAVSSVLVLYCRWRAGRGQPRPQRSWKSRAWSAVPTLPAIASAGAIGRKLTHAGGPTGVLPLLWGLFPALIQLGVPLALLLWVYLGLGSLDGPD